jgi:mannose-6-phosphate isomerase
VQARQAWTYANVAEAGWAGPWRQAAWHGIDYLFERYRRGPGRIATVVSADGAPLDDALVVYDYAFVLLAMSAVHRLGPGPRDLVAEAAHMRETLEGVRHGAGGFREAGAHPFQANAHMHLLEAALAWEAAGAAEWSDLADEIVAFALARFIDGEGGFLREFFGADWAAAPGDDGRLVEPGHQFEWAWLLERWGRAREREDVRAAARRLYGHGLAGVDRARGVAVNALWDDFGLRDGHARLWPQTEWLKAALILDDPDQAVAAAQALASYFGTPARGAWRDKLRPDGGFVAEPAPASSFYHIVCAQLELFRAVG